MTGQGPPRIHQLVVKIAGGCNLDCGYCYMYHGADQSWRQKPKLMSFEVFDAMLSRIDEYCVAHAPHRMSLSLHGGEPLLVGRARFERFVAAAHDRLGDKLSGIGVQTNATLIDDGWALLLARLGVVVGLSIDGPAAVHDRARPDLKGNGTHARAVAGLARLRAAGLDPMGLCVIDPTANGADVYDYLRSLGLRMLDMLIPDATYDTVARYRGRLDDRPIARFLIDVSRRWLAEDDADVQVRILYGLYRRLMQGTIVTDAFGNPTLSYLVIDTDGGIEGNDVLKICAPGLPMTGLSVFRNGFDDLTHDHGIVGQMVHGGIPLCKTCQACPEVAICGGGYLPHRWSVERGFDNPSVWCEDIKEVISSLRADCDAASLMAS